jgi:hypothetical protein
VASQDESDAVKNLDKLESKATVPELSGNCIVLSDEVADPVLGACSVIFCAKAALYNSTNPVFAVLTPRVIPYCDMGVLLKVLAPAKVCVPVVTSPLLLADALGILKVCILPEELIPKSVPVVPVAKVCEFPVWELRDVIPVPVPKTVQVPLLFLYFITPELSFIPYPLAPEVDPKFR